MTSTDELCGSSGIERLVRAAFGPRTDATVIADVGQGRGVFSDVYQVGLQSVGPDGEPGAVTGSGGPAGIDRPIPVTAVAKLPARSMNRHSAAKAGAYRREATAYRFLLSKSPVRAPIAYAVETADDTTALLLEDLTSLRAVDQMAGLAATDAVAVADALVPFHRYWRSALTEEANPFHRLGVRRSALSGFDPGAIERGLDALSARWPTIGSEVIDVFVRLVANGPALVERFSVVASDDSAESGSTLCHGDPRADNVCFDDQGMAVLFDWQQIAVQFAEADLAWLLSTSMTPDTRRHHEDAILHRYGADPGRYHLGLVLPGMAALLLAQRQADQERTRQFIATSLTRIGAALADHGVVSLAR